jgi:hypothetical protein
MGFSTQEVETETQIILDEGLESEVLFDVKFNRKTKWDYDANYGADADGNRGVPRVDVDDDCAEDITVCKEGECVFLPIETMAKELQERLKKAIDSWLEDNEPEEYEAPEPPCDDLGEDE